MLRNAQADITHRNFKNRHRNTKLADQKKKKLSNLIQTVTTIKCMRNKKRKTGMQIVPEIHFSCKRPRRLCVASSYLLLKEC